MRGGHRLPANACILLFLRARAGARGVSGALQGRRPGTPLTSTLTGWRDLAPCTDLHGLSRKVRFHPRNVKWAENHLKSPKWGKMAYIWCFYAKWPPRPLIPRGKTNHSAPWGAEGRLFTKKVKLEEFHNFKLILVNYGENSSFS